MSERLKTNWVGWATPGSYTWQVPVNVKWIKAVIVGGGGGGGGGSSAYCGGGGGGGGSIITQIFVNPGEILNISVGAGGSGGTGGTSPTNGLNGGNSQISLSDGTTLTVLGGGGGGAATSSAGGVAGGGVGSGTIVINRALFYSLNSSGNGGGGSSSNPGGGGWPYFPNPFWNGANQIPGPGLGGTGGSLNANGQAGKNGIVIIWWEE